MNISVSAPANLTSAPPASAAKAHKAAEEFESVLLASVLESLQKSFGGYSGQDSPGSENYSVMGTQALASAIAARGGIGIAGMILRQWQQTKVPELSVPEVRTTT